MGIGNLQGYNRTNPRHPQAAGMCDRCGFVWPLRRLSKQFQWQGAKLIDTGLIVCPRDLDRPFEQYRVLILPGDPIPVTNPRPDPSVTPPWFVGGAVPTTPGNQGFTQYVLGASTPGDYPTTKAAVLAQVAQLSGVPTPGGLIDRSVTLSPANTTVSLVAANPTRSFLLVYSPAVPPASISKGTALWGASTNLTVGPGQAWFWATAQGLGTVYQGAMTAIGLIPGMPLWCWEA
jgi:hypothetical protein